MECDKVQQLISLYIDGQLDKTEIDELEYHIENCDMCKSEFNQIIDMVDILNTMPQQKLPENFHNEIMNAIKCSESDKSKEILITDTDNNTQKPKIIRLVKRHWKSISALSMTACCIIVVFSSIFSTVNNGNRSSSPESGIMYSSDTASRTAENAAQDISGFGASSEFKENIPETEQQLLNAAVAENDSYKQSSSNMLDKKIIQNANIQIEVYNFDSAAKSLKDMATQSGGYTENFNSSVTFYDSQKNIELKTGSITLRIPSNHYSSIINSIHSLGKILSENESGEDITLQYVDTQSLLNTKQIEEQRLLSIMERADSVEDLILLEQRLTAVRSEIETYTQRLNSWDKLVEFSTIQVFIDQKPSDNVQPSNLNVRMTNAFTDSIYDVKIALESLAVWIAKALPIIILVIALTFVCIIVIVFSIKLIKRFKHRKI